MRIEGFIAIFEPAAITSLKVQQQCWKETLTLLYIRMCVCVEGKCVRSDRSEGKGGSLDEAKILGGLVTVHDDDVCLGSGVNKNRDGWMSICRRKWIHLGGSSWS